MSREFNYIVRLHGTNLDGTKLVPYALCDIKGVGIRLARTIVKRLGLNPEERLGVLSDADVRRLDEVLEAPSSRGVPPWMLNRRKDTLNGEDVHMLSSDLDLRVKEDIDLMRETRSWKGERHARGLKVRGQKTKTTARRGRSIGVSRKGVQQRQG